MGDPALGLEAPAWSDLADAGTWADQELEEARTEERYNYALAAEVRYVVRVDLSTGGPADWLEFHYSDQSDAEPDRVVYHFADWFDHASRVLDDDEAATCVDMFDPSSILAVHSRADR